MFYTNNCDEFKDMVTTVVELANANKLKKSKGFKIKKYQRINMYIYDQAILKRLLKEFKFKDAGNIYDYEEFAIPDSIRGNGVMDYSLFNRIGVSKKNKSLVIYNKDSWSIDCIFLVSIKKLEKFTKVSKGIVLCDDGSNCLKGSDFTCEPMSYLEISDSYKDETKKYEVVKKVIPNENLVFDKNSAITKVKNDILSFFTEKTEKLYEKLELPYKRGIILYGEPGNGKSAMIREIIRTSPKNISKIIIRRVRNLAKVLAALIDALNAKKQYAIIILEDMESMISNCDRSDLLNVLDGVDMTSGMFIIGTTNYLERIDSGFVNRAGRFDRTYKIDNPNKNARRLFFESKHLDKILSDFELRKGHKGNLKEIIDTFVKYSDDIPMASLKEIITSTAYSLAYNEEKYIENAVKKAYNFMMESRNKHKRMHDAYEENQRVPKFGRHGQMQQIGEPVDIVEIADDEIIEDVEFEEIEETEEKIHHIKVKRIK